MAINRPGSARPCATRYPLDSLHYTRQFIRPGSRCLAHLSKSVVLSRTRVNEPSLSAMSLLTPPLTPGEVRLSPPTTPFKGVSQIGLLTPPESPSANELAIKRLSIASASSSSSSSSSSLCRVTETSRPLSDNELSYFLPSRADGVNDM